MADFVQISVLILAAAGLYVAPAGIAVYRDHPEVGPITVLTLFLGWTGIGWVVALVWSCFLTRRPTLAR